MSDHDEDPVDRLRAADPAADVEPREGFGADVIAATTAVPAPADLDAERARRRPRRGLVIASIAASIAAAVVIGGVAGYAVAGASPVMAASDGPGGAEAGEGSALPPIGGAESSGGAEESFGGAAIGPGAGTTDRSILPWGWSGRNAFRTSTILSTAEGTEAAYGYDAVGASTSERLAALAAALGVEGVPEIRDGGWQVGPTDGSGPSLWASLDGTLSASYSAALDPWSACGETCMAPDEEPAVNALRDVLGRLGEHADAFEYTSETWEGSATRTATAWRVVDGQRVGAAWTMEYAAEGVVSFWGALADVVPMGDYPVVSEQEAFERLSDPRFGAQMTALPIAHREGDEGTVWTPPTAPPALPEVGSALSWGVNDVEIVSVRLGLAEQWQEDGAVLIVPTYEFTDAGGGTWSVIAVADESLDFSAGGQMVFGGAEVLY